MFSRLIRVLIASIVVLSPALALAQAASTSAGQAYPAKPIRLIVPFSPGGTNDILAQKQLTAMGAVVELKTPDEMRKLIPLEIAKWTKVAIDARMPRDID